MGQNVCGMSVVGAEFERLKRFNLAELYEPSRGGQVENEDEGEGEDEKEKEKENDEKENDEIKHQEARADSLDG